MTRLLAKADIPPDPDGCWNWTAAVRNGYGVLGRGARGAGIEYAHRAMYLHFHEFIEDGHEVCHTCDNRRCVNPLHLYAGTRSDNMRDASVRGRLAVPNRWHPGQWNRVPAQWEGTE